MASGVVELISSRVVEVDAVSGIVEMNVSVEATGVVEASEVV